MPSYLMLQMAPLVTSVRPRSQLPITSFVSSLAEFALPLWLEELQPPLLLPVGMQICFTLPRMSSVAASETGARISCGPV